MSKLTKSLSWAMNGIRTTWREEMNFRIELLFGFGILMLAKYLNVAWLQYVILIGCIGAVIAAEMVNTAIEDLCDRVEPSHDPVIGKIKDVMGGFVLVIAITSSIIGVIVFSQYL